MINYPSRTEERQERFYFRAEHKFFYSEEVLYPGEVKKLRNQGFKLRKIRKFDEEKNLDIYEVSWKYPYGPSIPHIVNSYIFGLIKTYPKMVVNNYAKELFIIASKAVLSD